MMKIQCFIKRSKEGAYEIIDGIFSIKDYGSAIIRMMLAVVVVLLAIVPLICYALILFTLNPTGNVIYTIGLLMIFVFLEIVWVKCIAFPLISCMDDDHQVGDSDH
jgi:hypothetical protein